MHAIEYPECMQLNFRLPISFLRSPRSAGPCALPQQMVELAVLRPLLIASLPYTLLHDAIAVPLGLVCESLSLRMFSCEK